MIILTVCLSLLVLVLCGWLRRLARRLATAERLAAGAGDAIKGAEADAAEARVETEVQRQRGDRMAGFVADIEKERDDWRKRHEVDQRGAGQAQALLMGEMGRLFRLAAKHAAALRAYGQAVAPVSLRKELRAVAAEHGLEVAESLPPAPGAPRAASKGPQESA